jgi:hypothetical protein
MSDLPDAAQLATRFYESVRAEMIQRIAVRDQILMFYIASLGAYLAFVYNQNADIGASCTDWTALLRHIFLLVPIPLLCLIFTLLILQHHIVIGNLGLYLNTEWRRNLKPDAVAVHWDGSSTLEASSAQVHSYRSVGQALVLSIPSLVEVLELARIYLACGTSQPWILYFMAALDMFAFVLICYIVRKHMQAHKGRRNMHQKASEFLQRMNLVNKKEAGHSSE